MSWKFWKGWGAKPAEATRPSSLGGPLPKLERPAPWPAPPLGGYSGKAPANPDAKPPKTTGTLGPAPRRPVAGSPMHGGPITDLEGLEPYTEAWRAKLQELLPQGAKVDITIQPRVPAQHIEVTAVLSKPSRQSLKDQTYGQIASQIAQLGTCCRLKVGCVLLTKEGRVAGMGYNGAGPGMPHCTPGHCNENCRCIRTVHAEQNALNASSGTPHTAYVTNEPCLNCTKELALAGVRRVVYLHPYSSIAPAERDARQEWLNHYNIAWEQLPATGAP